MKQSLGLTALAAVAALAVPSVAAAHPSVYTTTANVIKSGTTDQIEPQTRYVVSNHGYTMVLRETNKLNADSAAAADKVKGVVGYNLIPGGWRAGKPFNTVMATGGTGAQAHATCLTAALESEEVIKSWQDTDAFYNYVPFQSTSAGLEDDPARWLPALKAAGFDVSKLGDAAAAEAECEKVPGAEYVPADAVQTTSSALSSGLTKPLEEKNATLTTEVTELKKTVFTMAPLQSQVATLTQQVTTLTAANKPLSLKLSKLTTSGITAAIAGPPSSKGNVVVSLSAAQAKKLKLKSTTVAKGTFTAAADGNATATLKLTSAAKKALKKFKGNVTAEATAGDRFATAKAKFGK